MPHAGAVRRRPTTDGELTPAEAQRTGFRPIRNVPLPPLFTSNTYFTRPFQKTGPTDQRSTQGSLEEQLFGPRLERERKGTINPYYNPPLTSTEEPYDQFLAQIDSILSVFTSGAATRAQMLSLDSLLGQAIRNGLPENLAAIYRNNIDAAMAQWEFEQSQAESKGQAEIEAEERRKLAQLQADLAAEAEKERLRLRTLGRGSFLDYPLFNTLYPGFTSEELGALDENAFLALLDAFVQEQQRRTLLEQLIGARTPFASQFAQYSLGDFTPEQLGGLLPQTFATMLADLYQRQREQRGLAEEARARQRVAQGVFPFVSARFSQAQLSDLPIDIVSMIIQDELQRRRRAGPFAAPRSFLQPFTQRVEVF